MISQQLFYSAVLMPIPIMEPEVVDKVFAIAEKKSPPKQVQFIMPNLIWQVPDLYTAKVLVSYNQMFSQHLFYSAVLMPFPITEPEVVDKAFEIAEKTPLQNKFNS